jgi:hypothetical protein
MQQGGNNLPASSKKENQYFQSQAHSWFAAIPGLPIGKKPVPYIIADPPMVD